MIVFDGIRDDWRTGDALPSPTNLPSYQPEWWSIHWGGVGPYRQANWDDVQTLLMRWWNYHVNVRGWSDIAYNYAAPPADGSTVAVRLRGERPNGAQKNSGIWGPRTRTFVFYDGTNAPFPAPNQLEAFARLWQQDPLPVRFHRDFPDQDTQCPGDELVAWIQREGWRDYLPTVHRVGGVDRYHTAQLVADFDWQAADTAVVNGQGIDGVPASAKASAVLLTDKNRLPVFTADALSRVPGRVIIVGSEDVVSADVEAEIRRIVG